MKTKIIRIEKVIVERAVEYTVNAPDRDGAIRKLEGGEFEKARVLRRHTDGVPEKILSCNYDNRTWVKQY